MTLPSFFALASSAAPIAIPTPTPIGMPVAILGNTVPIATPRPEPIAIPITI